MSLFLCTWTLSTWIGNDRPTYTGPSSDTFVSQWTALSPCAQDSRGYVTWHLSFMNIDLVMLLLI